MKIIRLICGILIFPTILAFSFVSLDRGGFFNVDQIELIVEETPASPLYLQPLMKRLDESLEKHRGQSLWQLNLNEITRQIAHEEWIQDVTLIRRFPSRIRVVIQPKAVKLLYLGHNGKLMPVVADGSFLQSVDPKLAPDVPLLVGEVFAEKIEMRKKSVEALEKVPAEGSFSRKTISEIQYDPKEGYWMTLVKEGTRVKMGEDFMALKGARVSQVIDYLEAHSFQARVIDANLSKKVLVRLRKDP
jgi:cell division protein FtsQ